MGIEVNPEDKARRYSTIFAGDAIGVGHGQGRLDSPQAWSSATNIPNQFAQLDIGSTQTVSHLIIQPRRDSGTSSQRVLTFQVMYSNVDTDDSRFWRLVDEGKIFDGPKDGVNPDTKISANFRRPIAARFWRIVPITYLSHQSLRWGLGVCNYIPLTCPRGREENPDDSRRSYSSVFAEDDVGDGHARGRLDSFQGWTADKALLGTDFAQADLGRLRIVSHVITQARNQGRSVDGQRVTKYRVKYSTDGVNWKDVEDGREFDGNVVGQPDNVKAEGFFANAITARFFRIYPTAFYGAMSLRWGLGSC